MGKTQISGNAAEWAAFQFLKQQGLRLIQRNYRCKLGEIDLIMLDKDVLVFIEVRHRTNTSYGGSLQSITLRKQQRIIRSAQYYLYTQSEEQSHPCRFDVIGHDGTSMEWIKNAFDVSDTHSFL